ncbi:MAG TPA: YybS family protein [Desulfuromonadaceae bacterium]
MHFNQQSRTAAQRLGAATLGTAGSFILFAAYMVIPLAGFFSGLFAPLPAAFSRIRHGRGTATIIILGTVTLLAAAFGIQSGSFYLLQCGVIALVMPELLLRGLGTARTIAWTTAANLAVLVLAAVAFGMISGQNVHTLAVREINASMSQAAAVYEHAGIKGDELALLKQSMATAAGLLVRIYPALMTILLAVATGCNLVLVRRIASRMGLDLAGGKFTAFRNRDPLVWLLIAAGFAMLTGNPVITTPALNVLVIVSALYFLQGLAVVLTIIGRQSFGGLLRVMLFLMLVFQPYLAALVAVLGIFDLWGDFRTPRKRENL